MKMYIEMADQLERQAEEIVPVDARQYTSCYEALHENQDLLEGARSWPRVISHRWPGV